MQYDFNLAANAGTTMDIAGRFFKYKSGTGVIRVRTSGGGYVDLLPGQGVWNVLYTSLNITDKSGAANAGVIIAGDFDFHDDRIAGTVDVVDGGKARTMANMAFTAGVAVAAGAAATYAAAQLSNPAGSGRNIIVEVFEFSSPTAGTINWELSASSLATFVTYGRSKRAGGAANGVAEARKETRAIVVNPALGNAAVAVSTTKEKKYIEPVVLPPGYAINIGHSVDAAALNVYFEYFEELI